MSEANDEIDLKLLWSILFEAKWVVGAVLTVFVLLGVMIALSMPNVYRSSVLLAPAEENSGGGLAAMAGQLGGLASLAGVNLSGGSTDKTVLAVEVLKSREFLTEFIVRHGVLVDLFAVESWDQTDKKVVLDSDIYDLETKTWVRKVSPPFSAKPSLLEAYSEFSKVFSVSQDKLTNFVSISVEFYSPELAKLWAEKLVEDINEEIKRREVLEAKRSIEYLTGQLDKTSVAEMRNVFYGLIEEQAKIVMFAEARSEYVFKTIDSAVVPELKSGPNRPLIVIVSGILGGIVCIIFVVIRYFSRV